MRYYLNKQRAYSLKASCYPAAWVGVFEIGYGFMNGKDWITFIFMYQRRESPLCGVAVKYDTYAVDGYPKFWSP